MEVHSHTHTPSPPAGRAGKKWTHYFWEFLMLFLAVFCGFLAENQREHMIEHQREKKYIRSMIHDLGSDTVQLQSYIVLRTAKRKMLDSLTRLLITGQHKNYGNETYFFARQIFNGEPFVSTDGTMQQLKNAGNLRLVQIGLVVDSILAYDAAVRSMNEWDETDTRIRTSFREIGGTIFSSGNFYNSVDSNMRFIRPTNNPQLITDAPAAINTVSFQVQYLSTMTQGNILRAKSLKGRASRLMELLKLKYHIK
jgi:hypothetical protein